MKKLVVLLVTVALSVSVHAKSLRDLWISMPDTLMPILDKNLRIEFVDLKDMGVKAEVKNLLGENSVMDTLSTDYLQMTTSASSSVQMLLLPRSGSDSLLCVIKTFLGTEKESEVRFYDQQWQEVNSQDLLPADAYTLDGYFKAKPDTMSEEKFRELHLALEPKMWGVELSAADKTLVFRLSLPLLSNEEKVQLNALLMQRKFKWNDKTFNEI